MNCAHACRQHTSTDAPAARMGTRLKLLFAGKPWASIVSALSRT